MNQPTQGNNTMKEMNLARVLIDTLSEHLTKDKLCIKCHLGEEKHRPVCVICKKPFQLDDGIGLFFELSNEAVCVECVTEHHEFLKGSRFGRLGEAMLCWRNRPKRPI